MFRNIMVLRVKNDETKEHEKRHRSRRSCSLRTSVFSRIRRERSRSPRQRSKEGGVCPHAQTATAGTPIQNTQKLSQKVRITKAGTGSWKRIFKKRTKIKPKNNKTEHGNEKS
ncbi:hypothetical protein Tco_0782079, partial [Tanacetum coccineum]